MAGETGLAGAGAARDQDAGAAEEAAGAQHCVEPIDTAQHPLVARVVVQAGGGDRQHRNAALVDQERVLVGAVRGPAVLDHPQPPRGDPRLGAVVEQDHAVGDVFLQSVPRQAAVAALGGDDRGDALLLQPAEQPPQLGTQDGEVLQPGEQRLQRVEHDPLGAHGLDRVAEPDEKSLQVVVAGLLDLAALDADMVDGDEAGGDQAGQVVAERGDVLRKVLAALLEAHEHARLVEPQPAVQQERHGEQRFAAPGLAADQRRPSGGQPAQGDLVETGNPGRCFGHARDGGRRRRGVAHRARTRSFSYRRYNICATALLTTFG